MPKLNKTYNQLSGKGLKIVGLTRLSKGVGEDKVTSYIAENDLQYPIAKDKEPSPNTSEFVESFGRFGQRRQNRWSGHPAKITDQDLQVGSKLNHLFRPLRATPLLGCGLWCNDTRTATLCRAPTDSSESLMGLSVYNAAVVTDGQVIRNQHPDYLTHQMRDEML